MQAEGSAETNGDGQAKLVSPEIEDGLTSSPGIFTLKAL